MLGHIVELATDGGRLGVDRGFLTITSEANTGRIPIDDVEAVIASARGLTYSNSALAALAERGAPLVICGKDYAPAAVLMPMSGHFEQGVRMAAQASRGQEWPTPRARRGHCCHLIRDPRRGARARGQKRPNRSP